MQAGNSVGNYRLMTQNSIKIGSIPKGGCFSQSKGLGKTLSLFEKSPIYSPVSGLKIK
jgi:hypothetical protein